MNLTTKEIAYIFAMYLGCEYICDPNGEEPKRFYVNGETLYSKQVYPKVSNDDVLLLTPLSKLSDEHAVEVGKIYFSGYKNCKSVEWGITRFLQLEYEYTQVRICTESYSGTMLIHHDAKYFFDNLDRGGGSINIYQYLISKGYAVPLFFDIDHWANGKTAIELNLAINNC